MGAFSPATSGVPTRVLGTNRDHVTKREGCQREELLNTQFGVFKKKNCDRYHLKEVKKCCEKLQAEGAAI